MTEMIGSFETGEPPQALTARRASATGGQCDRKSEHRQRQTGALVPQPVERGHHVGVALAGLAPWCPHRTVAARARTVPIRCVASAEVAHAPGSRVPSNR